MEQMLMTIEKLEIKYAPHPLPYEGSDGFIHSADVHPPRVDFHALGFNSRRLPRPEFHPIQGCSQDPASASLGSSPGLLTNGGVIAVPRQLFGFEYVSGTAGTNTTWMMCTTNAKRGFSSSKSASSLQVLGGR